MKLICVLGLLFLVAMRCGRYRILTNWTFWGPYPFWHLWCGWDTADQGPPSWNPIFFDLPRTHSTGFPSTSVCFCLGFSFSFFILLQFYIQSPYFSPLSRSPQPQKTSANPSIQITLTSMSLALNCPFQPSVLTANRWTFCKHPSRTSHPRTYNSSFSAEEIPNSLLWHVKPFLIYA